MEAPQVLPAEDAFCRLTMGNEEVLTVEDAWADPEFVSISQRQGPLAEARFYASAPVHAPNGEIVGRGFNQPIGAGDPTAHAEIVAIREAARKLGNYRLTGATLVVTIEPCLMCVGALVHARIATLVYGAAELRTGAIVSTVNGAELPGHNHRFEVISGVREDECRALMQQFFRDRRRKPEA